MSKVKNESNKLLGYQYDKWVQTERESLMSETVYYASFLNNQKMSSHTSVH